MTTPRPPSPTHDRRALPPPLELDLVDAGRVAGRIRGDAVSFRGFADETEAAHAAWLAHRTLARRLARLQGTRPIPIDTEPLAIQRRGDAEVVLAGGAGGRPIATLLRPDADIAADDASGAELDGSFGFELRVPATGTAATASEMDVRAAAHQIYRTMRKSGLRWALWRPAPGRPTTRTVGGAAPALPRTAPARGGTADVPSASVFVTRVVLAAVMAALAIALLAMAPATVAIPLGAVLVGGLATTGLVATRARMLKRPRRRRGVRLAPSKTRRDPSEAGAGARTGRPTESRGAGPISQAVVAGSIALLMIALVLPEGPKAVLALLGFVGLMAFRLSAMHGGRMPRSTRMARAT